ncbi:MAG: hypothetical protein WDZ76_12775 [Pseudohongiellaceae bacterium]
MHTLPRPRLTASFLHFLFSCLVFFSFIAVLLLLWFPAPYFSASGGWQGLRLVAAVDLVLGPLLTLIVFDISKPRRELITDLSLIALLQLSALAWGIWTVYQQRPVAAVFWQGSFYTVPARALVSQGADLDGLNRFGSSRPVYVFAEPPRDEQGHLAMLREVETTQAPPHEHLHRYRRLADHFDEIRRHKGVDIEEIVSTNADMESRLSEILTKTGVSREDNHYVALVSRYRNIVLVYDRQDQLIGTLNAPLKSGPR